MIKNTGWLTELRSVLEAGDTAVTEHQEKTPTNVFSTNDQFECVNIDNTISLLVIKNAYLQKRKQTAIAFPQL